MLSDELRSISVPFKVIVYISTTIHISKHYTVQTFNLDSHKPFKGERDRVNKRRSFQSGREHRKECNSMRTHTHKRTHTHTIYFMPQSKFNQFISINMDWHYMCMCNPLPEMKIQIRMQIK